MRAGPEVGVRLVPELGLQKSSSSGSRSAPLQAMDLLESESARDCGNQGGTTVAFIVPEVKCDLGDFCFRENELWIRSESAILP